MPRSFTRYISWFCMDCDGSESGLENVEIDQTGKLGLILKKNEEKKKSGLDELNNRSRSGSPEILARLEDHTLERGTDVETIEGCSSSIREAAKDSGKQGSLGGGRCQGLTSLEGNEASVSAANIASNVAERDSSATKQRKLTPSSCDSSKTRSPLGALTDQSKRSQLPCDNRQLAVRKTSCEEAGSHIPLSEGLTAKCFNTPEPNGNVRAQPILEPVWRGFFSAKLGTFGSINLAAHLSILACPRVCEAARSLPRCLSTEMFPRLDIWPKSFLRSGGPSDESIGLFFFPCSRSDEKVFDALVHDMVEKDLAARIVLDNAELLLFTSYMLPMQYWRFQSKFYLWGAFRGKQASRH